MAYSGPKLSQMNPTDRAARVATLTKNPATRAAVPLKYLTPTMAKARALAVRAKTPTSDLSPALQNERALGQPVTPGSTMTNRDLAHQAAAAVKVQFGPADQQASQFSQQVPAYFQSYLAGLQQHAAATRQASDVAVQQDQQLLAGVRPLDQADSQQMQQAANQDAANRGTTAADTTQTASDASQVRQAMLAALATAQAGRGAAEKTYADTLANVTGPGEQLGAQQAAADKLLGIRQQEGAANTTARQDLLTAEQNRVIAQQALGLNIDKAKTDAQTKQANIDLKRGIDPVTGKAIVTPLTPAEKKTQADLDYFNTHGYYPPTGPPKTTTPKTAKPRTGPGSITQAQESTALNQVNQGEALIRQYHQVPYDVLKAGIAQGYLMVPDSTDNTKEHKVALPKIPLALLDAAHETVQYGGITPSTVKSLHDRGLHVAGRLKTIPKGKLTLKKTLTGVAPVTLNPVG